MIENTHKKITWSTHPLRKESKRRTFLLVVIVGLITFLSAKYFNLYYGALAFIVLFLSLSKYFFKTTYMIDDENVSLTLWHFKRSWKWKTFKRYCYCNHHLQLSPLKHPSRLDQYRSLLISLPYNEERMKILDIVKSKVGEKND